MFNCSRIRKEYGMNSKAKVVALSSYGLFSKFYTKTFTK